MRTRPADGFTLVELLVVVLIIGILIAVSAPSFLSQTQKANDSAAKQYLALAVKSARSDAVDNPAGQGLYRTGSTLASAIEASEPELSVQAAASACPSAANGYTSLADTDPKHVWIDTTQSSATTLVMCNDPTHDVWTVVAPDFGPLSFSVQRSVSYSAGGSSYSLTTTVVGQGSVSSSPAGISCGATCSASYSSGTVVTLTATPSSGYAFSGWSGACSGTGACSVTMSQAQSVTATFAAAGISLSFAAPAQYSTGVQAANGPQSQAALSDLNGDGKLDIVVGDSGYGASVMLGNGTGAFSTHTSTSFGDNGGFIAVGDLNGDGKKDIVGPYGNSSGYADAWRQGAGDGTFPTLGYITEANGWLTGWLTTADLNGDGRDEVLNGNGHLQSYNGTSWTTTALANLPGGYEEIAAGDVNGDGKPDVVVLGTGGSNNGYVTKLWVFINQGNMSFAAPVSYTILANSTSTLGGLALADMNGDGKLDAVATTYYQDSSSSATTNTHVSVILGNGDGTFGSVSTTSVCTGYGQAQGVAVGDLNKDGKPDVAVGCYQSGGGISVALGNGDGTLQTASSFPWSGAYVKHVMIGDVNNDGKLDVVALNANYTVGVFLNNGS